MRFGEGIHDVAENPYGFHNGELAYPHQLVTERFALDVGHHVVKESARLPRVVERQDMRVM